ncbi:MAG: helix-turn-helix domain-containing protein [Kordiimonadaceae bacterium]|nr:helix-turn-helix domain-containing protein [Kordiimonadaceae bacterium]
MNDHQINPPDTIAQDLHSRFPKFLTLRQVAEVLGCSYEHARQKVIARELTCFRAGNGAMRVPEADLLRYLEEHTCPALVNHQDCENSVTATTGTSKTDGNPLAPELLLRRMQRAS